MGSFILCHKKKAREPYKIARIHCRIFTIEELCYYLSNNLYLIDETIVNEELCDWLEQELELYKLAQSLREVLKQEEATEMFVMQILSYTSLYTTAELNRIQQILDTIKNQEPIEKQKHMADNLLEGGSVKAAIDLYLAILRQKDGAGQEERFWGKIYANLGAAYGRMFQYEEAARMYEEAYRRLEQQSLLVPYVYACQNYMSPITFQNVLAQNKVFHRIHTENAQVIQQVQEEVMWIEDTQLEEWKEQYRKCAAGER